MGHSNGSGENFVSSEGNPKGQGISLHFMGEPEEQQPNMLKILIKVGGKFDL